MIVITGGAGFIGSAAAWRLNEMGRDDLILVDELRTGEKWKNLVGLRYSEFFHKDDFLEMISNNEFDIELEAIIHLGACSATTEKDADYLMDNNVKYSQILASYALERGIRFIYASSAATYGDGDFGYDDNENEMGKLRPLNMYGYSKHLFDSWLKNNGLLNQVVGVKYFNVYGPNEYHKGDMRSVVHKAFGQINETGKVNLFKSYHPEYGDGEQKRDFIYVKDAVDMTLFFLDNKKINGLFNLGTGNARTWNDLVTALFNAMDKTVNIEYIEMPEQLRGKYQYFTQAKMDKIRNAGYIKPISSLEEGITDYVKEYLLKKEFLGY
ncbi:MAG: ADP-glyceromanno-heptose 6-epimerase [Melioribacteraceae bacterium]|nr:ADP-glyceromanno-heptose 6-epimerase [Melioribacteraceae bacterium]